MTAAGEAANELMDRVVTIWRRRGCAKLRLAHAGIAVLALMARRMHGVAARARAAGFAVGAGEAAETSDMSPAVLREHQRILAAYGGVYNDPAAAGHGRADRRTPGGGVGAARPALQSHHAQFAVDQRVRAADRPALRDPRAGCACQRRVRACVGAGARDGTRGRAARRDPRGAGQAGRSGRPRRHRRDHRSGRRRAGARQIEAGAGELLALAGTRGRRDRHRHRLARRLRPLRRGALSHLDGAQFRAQAAAERRASIRAHRTSCRRTRRRRSGSRNARANARQYTDPRQRRGRDRQAYLSGINGIVFGEDPSEGFVRGRRFLHPRLGFTFTAPEGFTLENTAAGRARRQARRRPGAAARRGAGAVGADARRISDFRLDREYRRRHGRGCQHQRLRRRHGSGQRRSMGLPPLRRPLRQRRLPLHLRLASIARPRPIACSASRSAPSAA